MAEDYKAAKQGVGRGQGGRRKEGKSYISTLCTKSSPTSVKDIGTEDFNAQTNTGGINSIRLSLNCFYHTLFLLLPTSLESTPIRLSLSTYPPKLLLKASSNLHNAKSMLPPRALIGSI